MKKRNYFNDWNSWKDLTNGFAFKAQQEPAYIWATYTYEDYTGSAEVIFYQNGQWHHVSGNHCSCFGLSDMWEPEAFDPQIHFDALSHMKRYITVSDSWDDKGAEFDRDFDKWFRWAVKAVNTKENTQ